MINKVTIWLLIPFMIIIYFGHLFGLYTLYEAIQIFATMGLVIVTANYAYTTEKIRKTSEDTTKAALKQAEASSEMAVEMKQTRLESVRPSLSIWPENYTFGGGFSSLYLRNAGGVAKELEIDLQITEPNENTKLYIPALDIEHVVSLPITHGCKKIVINCRFRDNYNQYLNDQLELDFSKLEFEDRKLAFQHSPLISTLKDMSKGIDRVGNGIGELKSAFRFTGR